ncbi:MAG: anthrone oxygenase family protein [Cyanobacteria bacterium J06649_11]
MIKKISAITAIIATAAFAGNMINIGLSYAIYWQSIDPLFFMEEFSIHFPLLIIPTAVTLLPALVTTLLAVLLYRKEPVKQKYWLIVFCSLFLTVVITLIYHLPTNIYFLKSAYSASEASSQLETWVILHWVRVLVAIIASVFTILGFQESRI